MYALTIRQPWALLVALGVKDVENRSRLVKHRGRILVHAGLRPADDVEWEQAAELFKASTGEEMADRDDPVWVYGAIIGSVEIVGTITASDAMPGDDGVSRWFFGPKGYLLADAEECPPVPCKGALGFWKADGRYGVCDV